MNITYAAHDRVAAEELASVFRASTLRRPVDDIGRVQKMIDGAQLIVTARDADAGNKLIGVARSITDFCYACYLSDLAVDVAYQRQGIGKRLVQLTRDAIGPQTMLLLIARADAMEYYPHIGFAKCERAWVIDRTA
jgi:predicted N-acetyltransferase YhbS